MRSWASRSYQRKDWLRKALLASAVSLAVGGVVQGATYYVDGNCPSSGSGATTVCGSSGPKRTIPEGLALLSGAGDKLNVRGVHSAHDGESSDFDGRYSTKAFAAGNDVDPKNGAAGNPIIIQACGWDGTGCPAKETVYIEGTDNPGTWTQCSGTAGSCNAPCSGLSSAFPCNEVWSIVPTTGGMSLASGAERPDGLPTRRLQAIGNIANQYDSYVQSFTPGARLFVRWGTTLPAKPYVFYDNANGFLARGGSSYITIRGFTVRDTEDAGIGISGGCANITIQDNKVLYALGNPPGGDYGIYIEDSQDILADSNEIAYTGSEGFHTHPLSTVASRYSITNNYIHHLGNVAVLGTVLSGPPAATPSGMIIAYNGGNGDYQGSVISGNLITDITRFTVGAGISLENRVNNIVVRNNIILRTDGAGINAGATVNSSQIYNNIMISNCATGGNGAMDIWSNTGNTIANNSIFNNTIINSINTPAVSGSCNGGTCTGNIFRNNIFFSSTNSALVNWGITDSTNKFQNNLVFPGSTSYTGAAVTFSGKSSSCAQIITSADLDNDGAANDMDLCANPGFTNTAGNDFHLTTGSLAINGGTSTGMPAGRKSINNVQAFPHGLPSYSDNSGMVGTNWDIGATEYGAVADTTPPSNVLNLRFGP